LNAIRIKAKIMINGKPDPQLVEQAIAKFTQMLREALSK